MSHLGRAHVWPKPEPCDFQPKDDRGNAHAQDAKQGKSHKEEEGELKQRGFHSKTSTGESG